MKLLLLLLLAGVTAVSAEPHPWDNMSASEICKIIRMEVDDGIRAGTITESEGNRIIRRCYKRYSK